MPDLFDQIETSSKKGDVFEAGAGGDLFDELTQKAPSPTWEALKKTAAVLPAQAAVTGREFLKGATLGVVDIPTPTADVYLKEQGALPVHPYVKTAAHMLGEFLPIGALMKIIGPVVKFSMAGAGMVRTAATESALTGVTYEAAKGAAQGKDPVKTLEEMGYAGPQWAGLGAAAGKLGAVLSRANKAKPAEVAADLAKAQEEIESTILYRPEKPELKIAEDWQPRPQYETIPYTGTLRSGRRPQGSVTALGEFQIQRDLPARIGPRPPEGGLEIPPVREAPIPGPERRLLAPSPDWIPGKPTTIRQPFLETPPTAAGFKGPEKVFVEGKQGPVEVKWNVEKKVYEPIPPMEKVAPAPSGEAVNELSESAKRALIKIEGKTVNGLAQDILSETPAKQNAAIEAVKKAVEEGKITQDEALHHVNNEMMNIATEKIKAGGDLNATLNAAQRAGMTFTERITKEVRPDVQAILTKLKGGKSSIAPRENSARDLIESKTRKEINEKLDRIFGKDEEFLKYDEGEPLPNEEMARKYKAANRYRADLEYAANERDLDTTSRLLRVARATISGKKQWAGDEFGKVDLDLLRHITISGLGAATGATLDEENRWRGAIIGGAAGFTISRGLLNKVLGRKFVVETPAIAKEKIEVKPVAEGPLTQPVLRLDINKNIANATEELFRAAGMKWDPEVLITDQITSALNVVPMGTFNKILADVGMPVEDFTKYYFRQSISKYAKGLGEWGAVVRRLMKDNPEAQKALDDISRAAADIDAMASAQNWWRRVDNIRRGLLVTQLATAMRNAETQVGRVGIDVFEQALDAGLQRMFKRKVTTNFLDGLESIMTLFRRGKKADIEKILTAKDPAGNSLFEGEFNRLYFSYSSDIMRARGDNIPEKIVDTLNIANRFQEYAIRRMVFLSKLDQRTRAVNQDLEKIIKNNEIGKISEDDIKYAVNQALEFTWAQSPKSGSLAQKFISFVNSMPGVTYALPFPRFLWNSTKFLFDYSPLGAFKLLSSQERLAVKGGDMRTISRAILGTAILGTAYQIRNSEYAGEKWYELNIGGRPVDTRAYNPFASYLFVADIIKKSRDGSLYKLSSSDIIQGLLSTNLRAGTGLYTVDRVLDGFTDENKAEKAVNVLKQFGGEVAAGFLTPVKQVRDFLYGFDDMVLKQTRTEPFLGPIKATLPGVEKGMEPRYTPTRSEPATWPFPVVRQLTGYSAGQPKNTLEKELDRLGFERREILPSVGDAKADNLIAQKMGAIAEEIGVPFVEDKSYRNMGDAEKGYFLSRMIGKLRTAAKKEAQGEDPALFEKLTHTPKRKERFLKSLEGG